jgi:proline iminopeptidase
MYSRINNTRLFFDVAGSGLVAQGPEMQDLPVLSVLHGSYLDHSYLKSPLATLQQDHQILYFDYRGAGRSERSNPSTWHIEQQADDFIALLDHLGIKETLVFAHSWGCHVASSVAAKFPQRVSGYILANPAIFKLDVFLETLARCSGQEAVDLAQEIIVGRNTDNFLRYLELLGPLLFQNPPPPELFPRTRASLEFFTQTLDELLGYDLLAALKNLDKPALILHGKHDPYVQEDNTALFREALTGRPASIHEYEASAHFVFLDEPDSTLGDIKTFLTSLNSASADG